MALSRFPNVKLSYEKIIHKKVYDAFCCLTIPEGEKCFAWFTQQFECIVMYISEDKMIDHFHTYSLLSASYPLCERGTILFGTVLQIGDKNWFHTEDVLYYKGQFTDHISIEKKWSILRDIFVQKMIDVDGIHFGLPLVSTSLEYLRKQIHDLPYTIRYIQFRRNSDRYLYHLPMTSFENTTTDIAIFLVKPDIQNDIYYLRLSNEKEERMASIPDYKTSVMMNRLFRNIKENQNLDALEESDEEEEFENNNVDKYVYLERVYRMVCRYNRRFGKWTPLRVAKPEDIGMSNADILRLEKNKIYR